MKVESNDVRKVLNFAVKDVANSFLSLSFSEKVPLTSQKIQYLMYLLTASEIQKGQYVLSETFIADASGPKLSTLAHYWANTSEIKKYAKIADGKAFRVGEKELQDSISDIFQEFARFDESKLERICKAEDGAWSLARKSKSRFVSEQDFMADKSFVRELVR
jgi:uncharacterized phage-associated protein